MLSNQDLIELKPSPWVERWRNYWVREKETLPKKIDNLKKGLDADSRAAIDATIERFMSLNPPMTTEKSVYCNSKDLLTENESELRSKIQDSGMLRDHFFDRFPKLTDAYVPHHTYVFHGGIASLPDHAKDRIKGSIVVDGGACCGDSAAAFSLYQPKTIYSFEPDPTNFDVAKELGDRLGSSRLMLFKSGLGSSQGKKSFYSQNREINIGATFQPTPTSRKKLGDVEIVALDDIFKQQSQDDISLIKLDIEGSELAALRGARSIIKEHSPALIVAIYHRPEDFLFAKPLLMGLVPDYEFRVIRYHPGQVFGLYLLAYVN